MDNMKTVYCPGGCGASTWYSTCVPAWKESVMMQTAHNTLRHKCTCAEA